MRCTYVAQGARRDTRIPRKYLSAAAIFCVRAPPRARRARESAPRHCSLSLSFSPQSLAVTNYINADGTSRAIAVFTARLSPLSRRHTTGAAAAVIVVFFVVAVIAATATAAALYQRPREGCAGGGIRPDEDPGLLGTEAANHRHHAENPQPRPRPPIRHRLRGSCFSSLHALRHPPFFSPPSGPLPPPLFFSFRAVLTALARFNVKPRRFSSFFIAVLEEICKLR